MNIHWTPDQDETLIQMYLRGTPLRDIAKSLHRDDEVVEERIQYLEKCDRIDLYV